MKTYNLFISHSWAYDDQYKRLASLLSDRRYFRYKNYSVPKDDPIHNANSTSALREAIRRQMAPSSAVLVLAGVYSSYGKWIDVEIDLAKHGFRSRKPIIAIRPRGNQRISSVVRNAADRVVGWNTESVVGAIRGLSK